MIFVCNVDKHLTTGCKADVIVAGFEGINLSGKVRFNLFCAVLIEREYCLAIISVLSFNTCFVYTATSGGVTNRIVVDDPVYTVPRGVGCDGDGAEILANLITVGVCRSFVNTASLGKADVVELSLRGVGVTNNCNMLVTGEVGSFLPLVSISMSPIDSLVIVSAGNVSCASTIGLTVCYCTVILVVEEIRVTRRTIVRLEDVVALGNLRLLFCISVVALPEISNVVSSDLALGELISNSRISKRNY